MWATIIFFARPAENGGEFRGGYSVLSRGTINTVKITRIEFYTDCSELCNRLCMIASNGKDIFNTSHPAPIDIQCESTVREQQAK